MKLSSRTDIAWHRGNEISRPLETIAVRVVLHNYCHRCNVARHCSTFHKQHFAVRSREYSFDIAVSFSPSRGKLVYQARSTVTLPSQLSRCLPVCCSRLFGDSSNWVTLQHPRSILIRCRNLNWGTRRIMRDWGRYRIPIIPCRFDLMADSFERQG